MIVDMKGRSITISKADLFADIDSLTFKFGDSSEFADGRRLNAFVSDSGEKLDSRLLERHIEYRDALLRRLLQSSLAETEAESADSAVDTGDDFTYSLSLSDSFRDSQLRPLAMLMHRYLIWGALYDWYAAGLGAGQANVFAAELSEIEQSIDSTVRVPSRTKRPLQPFGPAKRGPLEW